MRIQTTMIRKGGSYVEIDDITYHFAPQEDGRHVANVRNASHISTLLKIDGYQLLAEDVEDEEVEDDADKTETVLQPPAADDPADLETPDTDEDGVTVKMIDDESADEDGNADAKKVQPPEPVVPESTVAADISDEDLDALFLKEVGRKPNPAMKRENKVAKIDEARAGKNGADA